MAEITDEERAVVQAAERLEKAHSMAFDANAACFTEDEAHHSRSLREAVRAMQRSRQPPAPQECRPPKEHEGERWHWLENLEAGIVAREWSEGWWFNSMGGSINPTLMYDNGWHYLAPARPPGKRERLTDAEIEQLMRQVLMSNDKWPQAFARAIEDRCL